MNASCNTLFESILTSTEKEVLGDESQRAEEAHREEIDDATRRYILCLYERTREKRFEDLKEIRKEKEKELEDLKDRYEKSQKRQGCGRSMTEGGAWKNTQKL